jgi:predicted amidohydrolase
MAKIPAGSLRVLMVQEAPSSRHIDANVERISVLLSDWSDIDIAVFPELFVTGYQLHFPGDLAVRVDGDVVSAIRQVCADCETAFVGGYLEQGDDGCLYNSMLLIDACGATAGNYRKTHLFGSESSVFDRGNALTCIDLGAVRIAPMICFDMEIAEVARTLAFGSPDVFIAIAANMEPFYVDHLVASRARALDNRTPLVYVNRTGCEEGFDFVGGSRVVDSDGHVLEDLGSQQCIAAIDVPLRQDPLPEIDYLRHLRPELYCRNDPPRPRRDRPYRERPRRITRTGTK